jgi:hypothetical protein
VELQIGLAAGGEPLIAGAWVGTLMIPDEGLAVPTDTTEHGATIAAYVPVSESLILISLIMVSPLAWVGLQAAMHCEDITLDRSGEDDQLHEDIDRV